MWVTLQRGFGSFLKLCGVASVWALEEVPHVPMINGQRCSVVVFVVLLGTSHIYCLWTDFRVGRGLANPFLPSIQPSACAMPSRCLCFHAQVRPLPAQATSVTTCLYNTPSHFRLFHCPVSCLPRQRVFSFPLYSLFVSLGELSEPSSVAPTKQRQAWDGTDFLFLYRFL